MFHHLKQWLQVIRMSLQPDICSLGPEICNLSTHKHTTMAGRGGYRPLQNHPPYVNRRCLITFYCGQMAYSYIPMLLHTPLPPIEPQSNEISRIFLVTRNLVLARPFWNLRSSIHYYNVVCKKGRAKNLDC